MTRVRFQSWALLIGALALTVALAGCGGDDNGGLSSEDMARISAVEAAAEMAHDEAHSAEETAMMAQEAAEAAEAEAAMAHDEAEAAEAAAMAAEARADALQMQVDAANERAEMAEMDANMANERADAAEMANEGLEERLDTLEGRVDLEGFPSTATQDPGTGPDLDIGVEHVSGITMAAGDDFITNSPLKPRITPSHFLSTSYGTERRHHNVAFVNGVAAVGFGGRQYLDGAETYGGWMEFNHFGIFIGTDDDGREFTDKWSIGERSGSNPDGSQLEWNGAFVGREMTAAGNVGDRIRGAAMIEVALGDPLTTAPNAPRLQIDRARLTISDPVNIDNDNATALPYTVLRTGTGAGTIATPAENATGYTLPINEGLFGHGSDRAYEIGTGSPVTYAAEDGTGATFTVEGSFYGRGEEEVGALFNFNNAMDETAPYDLHGVLGADRRGN